MSEKLNHNSLSQDIDNLNKNNIDSVHKRLKSLANGLAKGPVGKNELKVEASLREAYNIVKSYNGYDEQPKIIKEYQDLAHRINESIKGDNKVTKQELSKIKLELQNLRSKRNTSYVGTSRLASFTSRLLMGTNEETEKLIDEAYGDGTFERGYSGDNLVAYDSEKGNYVISAQEVEKKIKNGEKLERKYIGTYVLYMKEKYPNEKEFAIQLSKTFGKRKDDIHDFLENGSQDSHVQEAVNKIRELIPTPVARNRGDGILDTLWKHFEVIGATLNSALSYMTGLFDSIEETLNMTEGFSIQKINKLFDEIARNNKERANSLSDKEKQTIAEQEKAKKEQIQTSLSQSNSIASKNLANTPLKEASDNSKVKELVVFAKVQEYDKKLDKKLQNELAESKKESLKVLQVKYFPGMPQEKVQQVFDKMTSIIRSNTSLVDSTEQLKSIIELKDIEGNEVGKMIGMVLANQAKSIALKQKHIFQKRQELINKKKRGEKLTDTEEETLQVATGHLEESQKQLGENKKKLAVVINGGSTIIAKIYNNEIDTQEAKEKEITIQQSKAVQQVIQQHEETTKKFNAYLENIGKEKGAFYAEELSKMIEENTKSANAEEAYSVVSMLGDEDINNMPPDLQNIHTKAQEKLLERAQSSSGAKDILFQQSLNNLEKELGENNPFVQELKQARQKGEEKLSVENTQLQEHNTKQVSKVTTGADGIPRITVTVEGETEEISITPEEAKLAQNNEKVQENIINFYTFFKQLNMEGVWKYRKELITAMGTVYINLEDDSLKEAELIKFGNNIAKIINGLQNDIQINTQSPSRKLLESELRKFSESGNFLAEEKTFNYLSEGKFTALMRSKGIIGGVTFKTKKIQELMQKGT